MQSYYQNQAQLPHFGSYRRQRGSGLGTLVMGAGRVALPLLRQYALPAAKSLGRELIRQGLPELIDVVTENKKPKQAIRDTIKKTARKQVGRGYRRKNYSKVQKNKSMKTNRKRASKRVLPKTTSRGKRMKRSRADFFARIKNDQ